VKQKKRCDPQSSPRQAQARLAKYRLTGWVSVRLEGREVMGQEDQAAREAEAQLDGCCVVESDLPAESATTQQVHDRYVSSTAVERDFLTAH